MLTDYSRFDRRTLLAITLCMVTFLSAAATADDSESQPPEPTDYELMRLFVETFQQVESNYVRDIDRRELMGAAINGMLKHLGQYSDFIPPKDFHRFSQMVEQEFGGIGITVNMRSGRLVVVSPLPGTPAHRAGIRAGDIITEVEGQSTEGISLNGAVKKLQGPVGRPVTVKVFHPGEAAQPREVKMVRQLIKAPTVRGDRYSADGQWIFTLKDQPDIGYIRL